MKLFGTDGIRGSVYHEPITPWTMTCIGQAMATFTQKLGNLPILIGMDTRSSGPMIEAALTEGIRSCGRDVRLAGVLPTAGLATLTKNKGTACGLMITASHNPHEDNGIKIFNAEGHKSSEKEEQMITRWVEGYLLGCPHPGTKHPGTVSHVETALEDYADFLTGLFQPSKSLKGLTLVLDCAHGAAHRVAPLVFERLGARVIVRGTSPDGKNINLECGSEHPEGLRSMVQATKADAGIAFDGDADRCVMVDEKGEILDGDHLMAMVAFHRMERHTLPHHTIVASEMSNTGFVRAMGNKGIRVLKTPVGDRNILEAVREGGFSLGGEQSGHLLFPELSPAVDGIITALQVLAVAKEEGKTLSELSHQWKPWPQLLKNIHVSEKPPLEDFPELQRQIKHYQEELSGHGRLIVRYSGTEPILRIMFEGEDLRKIQSMSAALEKTVARSHF